MTILRDILRYLGYFGLGFVVILVSLVLLTTLGFPEKLRFLIVRSGSMEPAVPLGSLLVIKPLDVIVSPQEGMVPVLTRGDVITFNNPDNPKLPITHRIYSIKNLDGQNMLETKGDANISPDSRLVGVQNVTGQAVLALPYLGYPTAWVKTIPGYFIIVILPTALIILSELMVLKKEIEKNFTFS